MIEKKTAIQFELPRELACPPPSEERKIERDEVKLLVTSGSGLADHTLFKNLDRYLVDGDVLVVNTSATRASAFRITLPDGRHGVLHFSSRTNQREWLIEIREIIATKTIRWKEGEEGQMFQLPLGATVRLKRRFYHNKNWLNLWEAEFDSRTDHETYMREFAQPIKYENLNNSYPMEYYQTFFSFHPGSAEMPSAGRGFTRELVEKLIRKGISFVRVVLHTGVSSLEENELPYPEYMEIGEVSALKINKAKEENRRIIAVGTSSVRAIESAVDSEGVIQPYKGKTDLFIHDEYKMKIIDGLITGFHEPHASHLNMLQALAGIDHVERAYRIALANNYYWHQFGDLHLILPYRVPGYLGS